MREEAVTLISFHAPLVIKEASNDTVLDVESLEMRGGYRIELIARLPQCSPISVCFWNGFNLRTIVTMNDTISMARTEEDDEERDDNGKSKKVNLPSSYVLKKHLMLILSLITTMFTVISWYMGTTNWLWKHWTSWIVLFTSLITSTIAILASVSVRT